MAEPRFAKEAQPRFAEGRAYLLSDDAIDKERAERHSAERKPVFGGAPVFDWAAGNEQTPVVAASNTPARGAVDLGLSVGSGMLAEPVAGLAGIAGTLLPGPAGQGADWVGRTRDALTYDVTPEAQEVIEGVFEAVPEPVREAASTGAELFGRGADMAAEEFGPGAGAAVRTLPAAALGLSGLRGAKAILRHHEKIGRLSRTGQVGRALSRSAPSSDDLLFAARDLYKHIDDAGIVVRQAPFSGLVDDIVQQAQRSGLDPTITPAGTAAVKRLQGAAADDAITLTTLDTLRKVGQGAASSANRADANIGRLITSRIDDFVENLSPDDLISGDAANVGSLLHTARGLTRRGRSSQRLQTAFENARLQASGFENGVRIELRKLLKSKEARFFTPEERDLMRGIVEGSGGQNFAKLVGRLGFKDGGAMNTVMGSLGVAGGAYVGGPVGAVVVPLVGQVSRELAERMTRGAARFLDDVVRAGPDARRIVDAYLKHTPRAKRNPEDLAQLLQRPDIALSRLPDLSLAEEAMPAVQRLRAAGEAALLPAATFQER